MKNSHIPGGNQIDVLVKSYDHNGEELTPQNQFVSTNYLSDKYYVGTSWNSPIIHPHVAHSNIVT